MRILRARFRYDVFISYSHREGKEYAAALKKQLAALDFSCFIDEEESPPGSHLDPTLDTALRKSAVLVLLATERALTRPYIVLEFERFGATERTIVPINILGALTNNDQAALNTPPWNLITARRLVWIDEADDAFLRKNPSPAIADGIDKLFRYTRRNVRVRAEIIGTAVIVLLAALGAGFVISNQAKEVSKQATLADEARKETVKQQGIALEAGNEATRQLGLAKEAKHDATRQQEIAKTAAAEAAQQLRLAGEAKLEADRQVERNRRLSYDADITLAHRSYDSGNIPRAAQLLNSSFAPSRGQTDLRGFEWYYLWRLAHRDLFTLDTHKARVAAVAFSPDGRMLATAGTDDTVKLWDMPSRREIATLEGGPVTQYATSDVAIAFSHDGKTLAIADTESGVRLWNLAPRSQPVWLQKWRLKGTIDKVVFSSDDKTLITGGRVTTAWDIASKTTQVIHDDDPSAFSADGKIIAMGSYYSQDQVRLLDAGSRKELVVFKAPAAVPSVVPIALSPNGDQLAVMTNRSQSGSVYLWDLKSGHTQELGRYAGVSASFSPDGNTLAIGSIDDATVRLWDLPSKMEIARLYGHRVRSIAFLPNGTGVATAGEEIAKVWDATPRKDAVRSASAGVAVTQLGFSADGTRVAVGDSLGDLTIWNTGTRSQQAKLSGSQASITALALSPDGTTVIFRTGQDTVNVWNVAADSVIDTRKGFESGLGGPNSAAVSPDGSVVATVASDGSLKLWDVRSRREFASLPGLSKRSGLVAFSPDHRFLVTNNGEDMATLWDVAARTKLHTLKWGGVSTAVFSPRGHVLVAALDRGEGLTVWDLRSRSTLLTIERDSASRSSTFGAIAFSPDERTVAIAYSNFWTKTFTVRLLDLAARKEAAILKEHEGAVNAIAFSRDGRTIATGGDDGTLKLWSATTYQQLLSTKLEARGIAAVLFSPDNKTLVFGDLDGTVRFLYATTDKQVAQQRHRTVP